MPSNAKKTTSYYQCVETGFKEHALGSLYRPFGDHLRAKAYICGWNAKSIGEGCKQFTRETGEEV